MSQHEARKVLLKDSAGRYVVPWTGDVETVNGVKPDAQGNVQIDAVPPAISVNATTLDAGQAATVQKSGTDKAPTFTFGIPRGANGTPGRDGAPGRDGVAGKITSVNATIDQQTGTPTVQVTLGGTESERTITLAFSGLKGETGPAGTTTWGGITNKPEFFTNKGVTMGRLP